MQQQSTGDESLPVTTFVDCRVGIDRMTAGVNESWEPPARSVYPATPIPLFLG